MFHIRFINIKTEYTFIINIIGDWGLGIGDWGLGIGPNPQSPIPNPQSPKRIDFYLKIFCNNYYTILSVI